jgi:NitT/TauT family transport system ATP-binding protein
MIGVRGVSVEYRTARGSVSAVKDVSLEIGREFLGLLGPSGCGKSTLLRVLAGLVSPTAGQVEMDGAGGAGAGAADYGIVFQDYSLLPWLNARQNIELGLRMKHLPPDEIARISGRLLSQLGLQEAALMLPHQLSGGMQQRVAVGRAFAPSPPLLLMDEPFGALDAITREEVQEMLAGLYEAEPHPVVFVTHDVEEALFLSDRLCILSARPGRVRHIITSHFPRPRRPELKRDPAFIKFRHEIEDLLRAQYTLP